MTTKHVEENASRLVEQIYEEFGEQFRSTVELLRNNNKEELADYMERSGYEIFYSDPRYTLAHGKLYIVGLNPGGCPERDSYDYRSEEYSHCVEWWQRWEQEKGEPYHSYLPGDGERWGTAFQNNAARIIAHVAARETPETQTGKDIIRRVFASNVCFYRAPGTAKLQDYRNALREVGAPDRLDCWTFHEKFLALVRPRIVLCIGNNEDFSALTEVHCHVGNNVKLELEQVRRTGRTRYVRCFVCNPAWADGRPVLVIGVPHLSRPFCSTTDMIAAIERAREKSEM